MRLILKPRPISIWAEPIEVGVMTAIITLAVILFALVRINERLRRVERIVTSL